MTRHVLRKGFSVQEAPGGGGQLTDSRTGDALLLSAAEFELLSSAGKAGLDPQGAGVGEVLARLGPFFVESAGEVPESFYELDIADAPTDTSFPSIAPVVLATASFPSIAPVVPAEVNKAPVAPARASPPRVAPVIPESAFPSGEAELRAALTTVTAPVPVATPEAPARPTAAHPAEPTGERPDASGQFLSQEANLRQALESHPTEQVPAVVMQELFGNAALPAASPVPPVVAPRPSRRPVVLTVIGVTLLALGVAATFALRPGGEPSPAPAETPPLPTRVVALPTAPVPDAGAPEPVDAGLQIPAAPEAIDAGEPIAAEPVDAGKADQWLVAEVQGRGRVKMGEVLAPVEGALTWEVTDGQRVKAKQLVGTVGAQNLSAPSVGLTIFKQQSGATVTRGTVLAEIIYFEAWARGVVKGATPTTAWRCEVASAATQQHADCKISVVAPRAGGALVTVAIEPRWFDSATDAVLRLAPP